MSSIEDLSDADFSALLAYLDGELDEAARFRLEDRLATDPGLAASFEAIAELDLLQRVAAEAQRARRVPNWRRFPLLALAIAAIALLCLVPGMWIWSPSGRALGDSAVLIESAADMTGFADLTGGERSLLPERVRGGSVSGPPSEEVVRYAREKETKLIAATREKEPAQLESLRYRVAFHAVADCYALVVQLSEEDGARRIFPEGKSLADAAVPLTGGADHVLPSWSVVLVGEGEEAVHEHRRGFVLPPGVTKAVALLALREEPIGVELARELDLIQAPPPIADLDALELRIREWLESQGFQVLRFGVADPDAH